MRRSPIEPPIGRSSPKQLQHLADQLPNRTYLEQLRTRADRTRSSLVWKPFSLAYMGWSLELAVDYTNQSTLTPTCWENTTTSSQGTLT